MNSRENNQKILFNNKYEQVRLLGEGSFGKAFLVESIEDRNMYVIKSINMANMSEDEKREAIQESTILEKLDHSNIIKFREVYVDKLNKQTLNIVMDYADGGDLQVRIKAQKGKYFHETQIVDWFTQICLAIKHIHDRKILHRDIKSQNIFLTKNGMVKLGDFGIAKCLNFTMDKAKTIVGTPYYLSPEIVHNKPYSFKSDIWSLGVLLYEMCALKMPFDAQNLPLLSLKIIKCSYNPLPPNFSKELRNLVNQMLCIDTNKRPNINEVLKAPIIKSRIKSFLTDKNYDSEFSHTILHKFNILKSQPNKIDELNQFQKDKDPHHQLGPTNPSDKNYQKPIVKRDNNTPNNINKPNLLGNNNNRKNYNVEKDREKEKDKEIDMLKKNLLNGPVLVNREIFPVNISKDNYNINGNLNNLNQKAINNNNEDKKHNLIINPGYALNYEQNRKNKPSLEIDSNRTPKLASDLKIPESNRRLQEKRESSGNYSNINSVSTNNNNNNNLNSQYSVGSTNDNSSNKERKVINKKYARENPSDRVAHGKKGSSAENVHGNPNGNLNANNSKGDSGKELAHVNHSANNAERHKRSGSRTSHEDKGDKANIKDFIKNIKDNNKGPTNNFDYLVINGKKEVIENKEESVNNLINQLNHNNIISNNIQNLHIYGANNFPNQNQINRKEKLNIPSNRESTPSNSNNNYNNFNNLNGIGGSNKEQHNRDKDINSNFTPKTNNLINLNHNNVESFPNQSPHGNNILNSNRDNNINNAYNNLYQNLFSNLNLNIPSNEKNLKDLNEYMETHKMLIELEKVQNDELEEVEYPEINDFRDEYMEENRKMNEEFSIDENNNIIIQAGEDKNIRNAIGNYNSNLKENLNYGNIIKPNFEEFSIDKEKLLAKEYHNLQEINVSTTWDTDGEYKLESLNNSGKMEALIRKELETELGASFLNKVYEILNKNINDDLLNYDFNELVNKIKAFCIRSDIDEHLLELSLNKIPDIYCLILRDRQKVKMEA